LPRLQATRGRLCLGKLNLKSAGPDTSPCSWNRQAEGEAPPERTPRPDGTSRLKPAPFPTRHVARFRAGFVARGTMPRANRFARSGKLRGDDDRGRAARFAAGPAATRPAPLRPKPRRHAGGRVSAPARWARCDEHQDVRAISADSLSGDPSEELGRHFGGGRVRKLGRHHRGQPSRSRGAATIGQDAEGRFIGSDQVQQGVIASDVYVTYTLELRGSRATLAGQALTAEMLDHFTLHAPDDNTDTSEDEPEPPVTQTSAPHGQTQSRAPGPSIAGAGFGFE